MYVCQVCYEAVGPGVPMRRYIVYRPDKSILKEIPVCETCKNKLDGGHTMARLVKNRKSSEEYRLRSEDLKRPVAAGKRVIMVRTDAVVKPSRVTSSAVPVCDLCGEPASDGQVTADTILCARHLRAARG